ncbi:tRNA-uridine aminocarboxypropyltransferase [Undibacterium sp.]|jgi:DTW domain-containing protein YfiP|uniref:tRNA-uridine aminocarboxypropyltransferase n=1 Tax=Undibacterium sp. TaxID=1914977 RepID=UPI002C8714C3|nr:tRNA-uridine aminocarboxypropyltransferase [Undibacterium sp.]HTD04798.1 tRNA-uridine aminocarboxypropyltransferase [Undibacterium sp.]
MSSNTSSQRPICGLCLRPQRTCICQWITAIAPAVEVIILQHPMEAGNAKGTARLLHLSLAGSRILAGEVFDAEALQALLHAGSRRPVLLYPDTPDDKALGLTPAPPLEPSLLQVPSQLRLIVLDGTWRKSRKMLYLNPLLQQLPRLPLRDPPASQYLIRKAHGQHQLSTLEAACYALMKLEKNAGKYQPLLQAFSGFIAQQDSYVHQQRQ